MPRLWLLTEPKFDICSVVNPATRSDFEDCNHCFVPAELAIHPPVTCSGPESVSKPLLHIEELHGGEGPVNIGPSISEKTYQGVSYRLILREKSLPPEAFQRVPNVEWRAIDDIRVSIVLSEKEGGVLFCLVGGKADYTGFGGTDPEFYSWLKELFLHYWDREKGICRPGLSGWLDVRSESTRSSRARACTACRPRPLLRFSSAACRNSIA